MCVFVGEVFNSQILPSLNIYICTRKCQSKTLLWISGINIHMICTQHIHTHIHIHICNICIHTQNTHTHTIKCAYYVLCYSMFYDFTEKPNKITRKKLWKLIECVLCYRLVWDRIQIPKEWFLLFVYFIVLYTYNIEKKKQIRILYDRLKGKLYCYQCNILEMIQ